MELGGHGALGRSFGHFWFAFVVCTSAGLGMLPPSIFVLFCFALLALTASPLVRHSFALFAFLTLLYRSLASTSSLVSRDAYPVRFAVYYIWPVASP